MVEWNGIFRLFRFSGILGQPREVHTKFRKEIPENVCSIRSTTRNFRKFWSNRRRPLLLYFGALPVRAWGRFWVQARLQLQFVFQHCGVVFSSNSRLEFRYFPLCQVQSNSFASLEFSVINIEWRHSWKVISTLRFSVRLIRWWIRSATTSGIRQKFNSLAKHLFSLIALSFCLFIAWNVQSMLFCISGGDKTVGEHMAGLKATNAA